MNNVSAVYISDDRLIQEGPGELWGFVFDCSTDGGVIAIYDGLDADSGRLLFHVEGWANDPNSVMFATPARFETGLYVVLDTNVSDASLMVRPLRSYEAPSIGDILAQLQAAIEG